MKWLDRKIEREVGRQIRMRDKSLGEQTDIRIQKALADAAESSAKATWTYTAKERTTTPDPDPKKKATVTAPIPVPKPTMPVSEPYVTEADPDASQRLFKDGEEDTRREYQKLTPKMTQWKRRRRAANAYSELMSYKKAGLACDISEGAIKTWHVGSSEYKPCVYFAALLAEADARNRAMSEEGRADTEPISVSQVMVMTGLSRATITDYIRKGRIVGWKKTMSADASGVGHGVYLVETASVERFLEARTKPSV